MTCLQQSVPTMMRAVVAEDGRLSVQMLPVPLPAEGEVLVKVHATAVNRADTLQRRGLYPVPPGVTHILGLEVSGTIVALATSLEASGCLWRPGDKIMAMISGGGYAEYVCIPVCLLMRVPSGCSLTTAAGIPETWLTAFQLLHLVGSVCPGDFVVVHAAGSGVGTAAIQLATMHGARVIATAGSAEKLKVASELGSVACINYREGQWAAGVREATHGIGAQLVLDPVGGEYWKQNVEALAMDGSWVLYGLMGGPNVSGPMLGALLSKRLCLKATTLRSRSLEYRSELTKRFAEHALERFERQNFKVVLDARSFTLEHAQAAHEYMESNTNIGKIIIHVAPEASL
mmetsp:Transcript_56819/g.166298  ORF Transcript_56819/g.166298 Transcript_56819/m.166298 type:complete len:345 (+) Transcript_56819:10-1044(+)